MSTVRVTITRENGEVLDTINLTDGTHARAGTLAAEAKRENVLSNKIVDFLEGKFDFKAEV